MNYIKLSKLEMQIKTFEEQEIQAKMLRAKMRNERKILDEQQQNTDTSFFLPNCGQEEMRELL